MMHMSQVKDLVANMTREAQRDLYEWLATQLDEDLSGGRAPLSDIELAVLIEVRSRELKSMSTSMNVLQAALGISRPTLNKRIERMNSRAIAPYLRVTRKSQRVFQCSTISNRIVRQPATAAISLFFEDNGDSGTASIGDFQKFGLERGVEEAELLYCVQRLVELQYLRRRGDFYSPTRRLYSESQYLRKLAELWPIQNTNDRISLEHCRNIILWRVWEQENAKDARRRSATTHEALVAHCLESLRSEASPRLAEHALRTLIGEGALRELLDLDIDGPIYYLNERNEPGKAIVTWPTTAQLLVALEDNLIEGGQDHVRTIEEVMAYAFTLGMTIESVQLAIDFLERSGYVEIHREGGHRVSLWRKERTREQIGYIRKLAIRIR